MPSTPRSTHDPYAALRHPNYRLYTLGNLLVITSHQMLIMAVRWDLYAKTGSALVLGMIGFVQILPTLILFLPGGHVADRFNRKLVTQLTTCVYMLCSIGMALASYFHASLSGGFLWAFYGLLFLMGVANAFYMPAKQSMLPYLVPADVLPNAVTWNSSIFQVAAVSGPVLSGFLIDRFDCLPIYIMDAGVSLLFLIFLAQIHYQGQKRDKKGMSWKSLMEGVRFVRKTKAILATLTMDLFAVLLGGCMALLPIFVKDILHEGAWAMGWLQASPFFGALLMAFLIAQKPLKRPGLTLLWAVAGFGATVIVFGLSKNLWLSMAMLFISGALDNISVIVRATLVQVLTPDRLLGRVQSVNFLFINSSNELGAFESGVAAALLGPVPAVVLGGIASIGIVLLVGKIWPEVARLGPFRKTA